METKENLGPIKSTNTPPLRDLIKSYLNDENNPTAAGFVSSNIDEIRAYEVHFILDEYKAVCLETNITMVKGNFRSEANNLPQKRKANKQTDESSNKSQKTSESSTTKSTTSIYMQGPFDPNCDYPEEQHWKVDEYDVTEGFMKDRKEAIVAGLSDKKLSVLQVFALNSLFFIKPERAKSSSTSLPFDAHEKLLQETNRLFRAVDLPDQVPNVLNEMGKLTDVFQMKRKGIEFMAETVKEGNTPTFQASEVIFKLVPKVYTWSQDNMIEDSFIHNCLEDVFETIMDGYQAHSPIRFEWASNKSSCSSLKPDYINHYRTGDSNKSKLDLFVMEVKAPGRNKTSGDFNKLGFIMGNMLDDLVDIGIINPILKFEQYKLPSLSVLSKQTLPYQIVQLLTIYVSK